MDSLTTEQKINLDLRRYPVRPHVGVGGVIRWKNSVLLIKRKYDPDAEKWAVPGGHLKVGETAADGAKRECEEETGLKLVVVGQTKIYDKIMKDSDGKIEWHYVLIDFLMEPVGDYSDDHPPIPIAQSDALDAKFVPFGDLKNYILTDSVQQLLHDLKYF
jgi:ADP-ribose pyrophosphatase YjhB (NUDIX family)